MVRTPTPPPRGMLLWLTKLVWLANCFIVTILLFSSSLKKGTIIQL
uniref:Uncharacterized protein n=1 Tax=Rhizophora mucronata TaxID=61149 RepID=A0A2P2QFX8_RHIMU